MAKLYGRDSTLACPRWRRGVLWVGLDGEGGEGRRKRSGKGEGIGIRVGRRGVVNEGRRRKES